MSLALKVSSPNCRTRVTASFASIRNAMIVPRSRRPPHVGKCGAWPLQQRQQGRTEQVFHPRPPGVHPLLLERVDEAGGDHGPVCGDDVGERIVPVWGCGIGDVPVHVVWAGKCPDCLGEVSVWIYKAEALTVCSILSHHVCEQRGFAGARLPSSIDVEGSIGLLDAKRTAGVTAEGFAENGNGLVDDHPPILAGTKG